MKSSRVTLTTKVAPVLKPVRDKQADQAAFERMKGVGAAKPSMQYTGTNMLGIATMHKSNAVPVFSSESAEDISKMRR